MKTCVFAGPTLWRAHLPDPIVRFGPAALGSVFRAVEAGYRRIGIVDGCFGNLPSVWHKEVLFAIASGVEVVGAGSIGALRAAELDSHGMLGIGVVFRMFRAGRWTDDDELAVIHATEELDFEPLSDAMANVRFTLRDLRRRGHIGRPLECALVGKLKSLHFSERTRDELIRQIRLHAEPHHAGSLVDAIANGFVDVKRRDARALVDYLAGPPRSSPPSPLPEFRTTIHWRRQFEQKLADVPPLRPWAAR